MLWRVIEKNYPGGKPVYLLVCTEAQAVRVDKIVEEYYAVQRRDVQVQARNAAEREQERPEG